MTHVQRKELITSLENLKHSLQFPIGAVGEELEEENLLTALCLTNDEICIPATKKEIHTIEQLAEMVEIGNWQIEWRIKGSEITSLSPSDFLSSHLSELVASSLEDFRESSSIGIDSVEVNLSHLALYRAVEARDDIDYDAQPKLYTNVEYTKKWAGSFATLLLQIPVAGGFQGGNFYLKNRKQQSKVFNTSRNSQKAFHVTAFYDDSQIYMEPITKGARIDLVFNLRHKGSTSGIARPLSEDHDDPLYRIWQSPSKRDNKTEMSALLSKKDKVLIELLSHWKRTEHSRVELYAIPLDHSYCKNSLSFNSLKGIDRSMAEIIVALLGDFVEVHLATVTKYVGYAKEDWISSGREYVLQKTNGKSPKHFRETDWTEYFAGNWVDICNRRLTLPPLSITVPEELLGFDEAVFHQSSNTHLIQNAFDGYSYDRSAIIVWPRNQTFSTAVSFGLDQALDVVESSESDPTFPLAETKKAQLQYLLALCKKEPNKSWYASTSECSDLRCDRSNPVSLQVASKRALRLINLCLLWNMSEFGLELLRLLFSKVKSADYRCSNCSIILNEEKIFFVGGICSNEVADKVGELIVLLDWTATKDCLMQVFNSNVIFDFKQIGQLAHLVIYLFLHQSFEAADYIEDQVFRLLTDFYLIELDETRSTDTVVDSCINMLILVDGLSFSEESRLMKLLFQLKSLSSRKPSLVISWLQKTDKTLIRSLSPYFDFYIDTLTHLESRLVEFDGCTNNFPTSVVKFEEDVALLMTSLVRTQDGEKLNRFTERITSSKDQGARLLLAAVISTKSIWAVPSSPLIETTVISLSAIRVQQLIRFKFPIFKWEQPDAILKELPSVEAFLHSTKECLTYDAFASKEEAQLFSSKYFSHSDVVRGYSAKVSEVIFGSDGRVSVIISKTAEIYETSKKQLEMLEATLSNPCSTFSPAKQEIENSSELLSTPNTSICQVVEPRSASSTKRRPKKNQNRAPPEKRSKRILIKNQPKEADHEESIP